MAMIVHESGFDSLQAATGHTRAEPMLSRELFNSCQCNTTAALAAPSCHSNFSFCTRLPSPSLSPRLRCSNLRAADSILTPSKSSCLPQNLPCSLSRPLSISPPGPASAFTPLLHAVRVSPHRARSIHRILTYALNTSYGVYCDMRGAFRSLTARSSCEPPSSGLEEPS